MRNSSNALIGDFRQQDSPIGAGGYIVSMDISTDGSLMVHCPDVIVPMIRNYPDDTRWRWMLTHQTMGITANPPVGISNDGNGSGGTRIAPSNKNIIYSYSSSRIWKSINGGANFVQTAMGEFDVKPNTQVQRYSNRLIDVHPTNPDIVIHGTNYNATNPTKSGAFYSLDGGATSSVKIAGLDNATLRNGYGDRHLVAFDPGDPNYVYIHVGGVGLYQSTTGVTGTFTLITGAPIRCGHLHVTASGTVFVCGGGSGGGITTDDLYKRTRAGTASSITTSTPNGCQTIAVNPANENIIFVANADRVYCGSFDGGTTWKQYVPWSSNIQRSNGEVAWLSDLGFISLFAGMMMFDPAIPNKLWVAHGTGIAWCIAPTSTTGILDWHDFSNGNEEKVAHSFLSIPGKPVPILGNWDYSFWKMNDLDNWTNRGIIPPLSAGNNGLAIATAMDFASDDPNFIVSSISQSTGANARSLNAGDSWEALPNQDTNFGNGGCIACNTKDQIIITGTNNARGHWTNNGGQTWGRIQLVPGTDTVDFANAFYVRRHNITADKTRPGYFALVYTVLNNGSTYGNPLGGLWITTNSGQTWTQTYQGIIGGGTINGTDVPTNADRRQFWACRLHYVPGYSGEMLYTNHADGVNDRFWWIKNDGATTEELMPGVISNVNYFDFGPAVPGQTRPSVAFYGQVNGVLGLYLSIDWFVSTPILISANPLINMSGVGVVGCDRNKFGRIFAGGIGWIHTTYGKRLKIKAAA